LLKTTKVTVAARAEKLYVAYIPVMIALFAGFFSGVSFSCVFSSAVELHLSGNNKTTLVCYSLSAKKTHVTLYWRHGSVVLSSVNANGGLERFGFC